MRFLVSPPCVRDSPDLRDEHRKSLQIVNRSGENLLSLIDDVLDMAKIEAGRMTLEERDFDVASLVRDNIDMMRAHAGNKGLDTLFREFSLRYRGSSAPMPANFVRC